MIRVWKSVKWQLKAVFYELRTAAVFFLILNALLFLLPVSVCQFIDRKAGMVVMLVSICYGFSLFAALIYCMNHMIHARNSRRNELWYLAEPNPWLRILSRLAAVAAVIAATFLNGQAGTILMRKFADENHSYFRMEMKSGLAESLFQLSLLLPLMYLLWDLNSKRDREHKGRGLMLIATLIFGQMILDGLKSLPAAAGITAAALLIIFLFWKSGKMEGTRDVL